MVLLPPPQPAPLSLPLLFHDPASAHSTNLTRASASRARVRTVLKADKKGKGVGLGSDGAGPDWVAALAATEAYLPFLLAVMACVESDDLIPKTEPVFTWKFSLSTQTLKKAKPKITMASLQYELAVTLLTHALCLANRSATMVASLGSYETSASNSSAAIKTHDETINAAAELLCRASGVLVYLAEVVLPKWESVSGDLSRGRPVELSRDVITALSKLFIADANLLAIRRLLSRVLSLSSHTVLSPPLPSTHPSPSLLAKLHLHVYTLYDEARSLCKTTSRASSDAQQGEVVPELRRYLSDGRTLAQALAYKWLGVDAGENGGREKAGDAIAWLKMAKDALEEVDGKSKGLKALKIGKGKSAGKERKGKLGQEEEAVKAFMSAYKKVNDTVHFQPLPPPSTLLAHLPAGRPALTVKPFTLPLPAFRPRGLSGVPPPATTVSNDLDIDGLNLAGGESSDEDELDAGGEGGYFGVGSYW